MYLWVQEDLINLTESTRYGEGEPTETCYELNDTGGLHYRLAGEYGRCRSKVYLDTKSRGTIAIGWVFQKKVESDDVYRHDTNDKREYLREVWVTVMEPCELDDPLALRRTTPAWRRSH
jgi:hypothetical protein